MYIVKTRNKRGGLLMRKIILTLSIFAVTFAFTLIILSFSFGLKLSAEPIIYFLESLKHMFLFKSVISCAAGLVACFIFVLIGEREEKK